MGSTQQAAWRSPQVDTRQHLQQRSEEEEAAVMGERNSLRRRRGVVVAAAHSTAAGALHARRGQLDRGPVPSSQWKEKRRQVEE